MRRRSLSLLLLLPLLALALASGCSEGGMVVQDMQIPDGVDAPSNAVCDNGVVETGELCDTAIPAGQPGACPVSCDDGVPCTLDIRIGTACQAECQAAPLTQCTDNDGCCPSRCDAGSDTDCASVCGNGVVEAGESCDGNCPVTCGDGNTCTGDVRSGRSFECNVMCTHPTIGSCSNGDGCCPNACNSQTDDDCSASCGNGIIESPERCDGNCPATCDDGNACTRDTLTGSAGMCNVQCAYAPISVCSPGDGCCPPGCNANNDADCSASCGNNMIEPGETCDGNCPTSCSDGAVCTTDTLIGSACTRQCVFTPITQCIGGDGCCPTGCNAGNDGNCVAMCGNNIVEPGETCDGNCPTGCNDNNACTTDTLNGTACTRACTNVAITTCTNGDSCCPSGCNATNDNNCVGMCGNSVVEPGETCDGNCPTSCNDGMACTTDTLTGTGCTRACTFGAITMCVNGDGCCPMGCNSTSDNNCTMMCGNGVVEGSELCDGNCPTTCPNDGNSCTSEVLTGTVAMCNRQCTHPPITTCTNGDGCCAPGCNRNNDNDCPAVCGNGIVESPEICDGNCPTTCASDGNACTSDVLTGTPAMCNVQCTHPAITTCASGDGCCPSGCTAANDNDCVAPVAYRFNTMALRDPHIFTPSMLIGGCVDITNNGILTVEAVNASLQNSLNNRTLNPIMIFNPLNQAGSAMGPLRIVFGQCSSATNCTAGASPPVNVTTTYTNGTGSSTCLAPHAGTTNGGYTPAVPTVGMSCFTTGVVPNVTVPIILSQGTLNLPLQNVELAAIYNANPATGLTTGLLRGFLSETSAANTDLPDGLPFIGGDPLSRVLKSGANNNCSGTDDRDFLMPPSTGARGWWFYVVFTAQQVTFN